MIKLSEIMKEGQNNAPGSAWQTWKDNWRAKNMNGTEQSFTSQQYENPEQSARAWAKGTSDLKPATKLVGKIKPKAQLATKGMQNYGTGEFDQAKAADMSYQHNDPSYSTFAQMKANDFDIPLGPKKDKGGSYALPISKKEKLPKQTISSEVGMKLQKLGGLYASQQGMLNIIKSINAPTKNGEIIPATPENVNIHLMHSAKAGSAETMKKLLAAFPDMNQTVQEYYQQDVLDQIPQLMPLDKEDRTAGILEAYQKFISNVGKEKGMDGAKKALTAVSEQMIYQAELSDGKEVYLLNRADFPVIDKISYEPGTEDKFGDTIGERVTGFSIKSGKNGIKWGRLSPGSKYFESHPNPTYANSSFFSAKNLEANRGIDPSKMTAPVFHKLIHDSFMDNFLNQESDIPKLFFGINKDYGVSYEPDEIVHKLLNDKAFSDIYLNDYTRKQLEKDPRMIYPFIAFMAGVGSSNGFHNIHHAHVAYDKDVSIRISEPTPYGRNWVWGLDSSKGFVAGFSPDGDEVPSSFEVKDSDDASVMGEDDIEYDTKDGSAPIEHDEDAYKYGDI